MTFKAMLDAGHDQFTPGKGVASMKEFEFNRAVVLEMDKLLKGYENVETRFSHDLFDGVDDSLTVRTNRANAWGATCFASVHANAAGATSANGIETFVHPNAPQSTVNLGAEVQGELIRSTGLTNRGLKKTDFAVLRQTHMDAFLAECGFMTNAGDLAKLKSHDFRVKCAQAIVNGMAKHYKLKKKTTVKPTTPTTPTQPKGAESVGIGTLKVLENTVIREQSVYTAAIMGNVKPGEAYIVHDYLNGWYNIGGWVHKNFVQFTPINELRMVK